MDCITLNPVPLDEKLTQITERDRNQLNQAIDECKRHAALLERCFGKPPGDAYFKINLVEVDWDYGAVWYYPEVRYYFDPSHTKEKAYAGLLDRERLWNWEVSADQITQCRNLRIAYVENAEDEDDEEDE